ncbi:MAG TPA: hypothetical protein PLR71_02710 [Deltaproteobacteria bacterium]|nr:hypothetical protein [Deltaproteobacteria bacterium]HQI80447.1 hypothetical protein [Deltaproteobacteria bacterium]
MTSHLEARRSTIEQTRKRVLHLLVQCIKDIQEVVESTDMRMKDIGLHMEILQTPSGSYSVEIKLSQ